MLGRRSIVPRLNGVSGPVGGKLNKGRFEEVLEEISGDSLGVVDTVDRWRKGRRVSIEREAEETLFLQEGLDDLVVKENMFPEDPELVTYKGIPPCKRVRKEG